MNRLLKVDFWVPDGEWWQLAGDVSDEQERARPGFAGVSSRVLRRRCDAVNRRRRRWMR